MGRKKEKADYNPERIQQEMMDITVKLYKTGNIVDDSKQVKSVSLRFVALELDISVSKVVKLLIFAGEYTSDMSERVMELYEAGKSVADIQEELGISRAAVHYYLPYKKGIYNAKETSLNAERIKRYRVRSAVVKALQESGDIDDLWKCVELFEGYGFSTAKGLKFRYAVKGREVFVDRKESSKSITRSMVELAYKNGVELMKTEGTVTGPKKLGTFGASYLYPMFIRFGVICGK